MVTNYCGRCHTCGAALLKVLDGEEWCPACEQYRRYLSHGWSPATAQDMLSHCPDLCAYLNAQDALLAPEMDRMRAIAAQLEKEKNDEGR